MFPESSKQKKTSSAKHSSSQDENEAQNEQHDETPNSEGAKKPFKAESFTVPFEVITKKKPEPVQRKRSKWNLDRAQVPLFGAQKELASETDSERNQGEQTQIISNREISVSSFEETQEKATKKATPSIAVRLAERARAVEEARKKREEAIMCPPTMESDSSLSKPKRSGPPAIAKRLAERTFAKDERLSKRPTEQPVEEKKPRRNTVRSASVKPQRVVVKARRASAHPNLSTSRPVSKEQPVRSAKPTKKALPRSRTLTLSKPKSQKRTSAPVAKGNNTMAHSSIFYDNKWMDKQEEAFTVWINERIQRRACLLEQIRESERNRGTAYRLWNSLADVWYRIDQQTSEGKLAMRDDVDLFDVGLKKKFLDMLFCFRQPWLKLGLEAVYQTSIDLRSQNPDAQDAVLRDFVKYNFISNDAIEKEFAVHVHGSHVRFRKGYQKTVKEFIVNKFIKLLFFLDQARSNHVIASEPRLFRPDSEYKDTRSLLVDYCKYYLKGEGDIVRHLKNLGCVFDFKQGLLDEIEFSVDNLAVDLRDGVRLAKLAEILIEFNTGNRCDVLSSLRLPAADRMRKVFNVETALRSLVEHGFPIRVQGKNRSTSYGNVGYCCNPYDLVDGSRDKTLFLLWQVILYWDVNRLLKNSDIRDEIALVRKVNMLHTSSSTMREGETFIRSTPDDAKALLECSDAEKLYMTNEKLQLLLQWVQSVVTAMNPKLARVSGHNVQVNVHNFTSSLADGRALCMLISYYHPKLLPISSIKVVGVKSTERVDGEGEEKSETVDPQEKWVQFYNLSDTVSSKEELIEAAKDNIDLLNTKIREIGGIPALLNARHMVGGMPDEKVMIAFVTYLCVRLLEVSQENHATRVIQMAWRTFSRKKEAIRERQRLQRLKLVEADQLMAKKKAAAAVCALMMQSVYEIGEDVAEEKYHRSTIMLDTVFDVYGRLYKRQALNHFVTRFKEDKNAAVTIQRVWRGVMQRKQFRVQLHDFYERRRFKAVFRSCANEAAMLKRNTDSSLRIQAWFRGSALRRRMREYVEIQQVMLRSPVDMSGWTLCTSLHSARVQAGRVCAAVMVQRNWRRKQCTSSYTSLKKSTITLQSLFRRRVAMNTLFYLKREAAATRIQSVARMSSDRRLFVQTRQAAVVVQAAFRMFTCRKNYIALLEEREKARIAEEKRRAQLALAELRNESACTLQAYFRGYTERKEFSRTREIIVRVQQQVRLFLTTRRHQHSAATSIQAWWKGRTVEKEYLYQKSSAVVIQAAARMWLQRRVFLVDLQRSREEKAATHIQSVIRMCRSRKAYNKSVASVRFLQKCARMQLERIHCRNEAALVIQTAARGFICRNAFARSKNLVIFMQSCLRRSLAQATLRQLKAADERQCAATVIQGAWNRYVFRAQLSCLQVFITERSAAISIQCAWKQSRSHSHLSTLFQAALEQKSAITIQCAWKAMCARAQLASLRQVALQQKCATAIQCAWKSMQARKTLTSLRLADAQQKGSIIIQCAWRQRAARVVLASLKQERLELFGAVTIQCAWRQFVARRKLASLQQHALEVRSAVSIQCAWKQHVARVVLSSLKQCKAQEDGALVIQCVWRQFLARRELSSLKQHALEVTSALSIQCAWRQYASRALLASLRQEKAEQVAATVIQCAWKQCIARRELSHLKQQALETRSAETIQCAWKQRQARAVLAALKHQQAQQEGALTIQCAWRCYQARLTLSCLRRDHLENCSALTIQCAWKAMSARAQLASLRQAKLEHDSANVIQCGWKSYTARRVLSSLRQQELERVSSIVLQSAWKCFVARRELALLRHAELERISSLSIQCAWRCHIARTVLSTLRQEKKECVAATTIQCAWKSLKARNTLAGLRYQKQLAEATLIVQSIWRGKMARCEAAALRQRQLEEKSALVIQCAWKCYVARSHLHALREEALRISSALSIQCAWKQHVARAVLRALQHEKKRQDCAVIIQCSFRSHVARRTLASLRQAEVERVAALTMQCAWRQHVARRVLSQLHAERVREESAVVIQNSWRCFIARQTLADLKREREAQNALQVFAARRIQACYRKYRLNREFREKMASVVKIQAWARARMAVRRFSVVRRSTAIVQKVARGFLARRAAERRVKAILCLQSVWRGRRVRKTNSKQVRLMRKKVIVARRRWRPENTVGYLTRTALEILLQSKQLAVVTQACKTLDLVTRLLVSCCVDAVEHEAVPVIFALMQSCNRSEPHLELVNSGLNVLLNIAKCRLTTRAVFESDDCPNLLVEQMQIYRDKQEIFMKSCTLLRIGSKLDDLVMRVHHIPGLVKKVGDIHQLVAHKHKMLEKTSGAHPLPKAKAKLVDSRKALVHITKLYKSFQ